MFKAARKNALTIIVMLALSLAAAQFANAGQTTATTANNVGMLGSGAPLTSGDNTTCSTAPGLNTYYNYFLEVTPGTSQLVVEIFDADVGLGAAPSDYDRGNGWDASCTYTLRNPAGAVVATITGNAAGPAGSNEAWIVLATVASPANGHWEVRADMSTAVTTGDDWNGYGVRAHDGDPTASGTEIAMYSNSFLEYGSGFVAQAIQYYPWVSDGNTWDLNDWDGDGGGTMTITSRSGAFVRNYNVSGATVWQNMALAGWVSDLNASEYGIWTVAGTLTNPSNFITVYAGSNAGANPPPASQPQPNAFRIYWPADGAAAPQKPYLTQNILHVSGPNPLQNGVTTTVKVEIRFFNPTDFPVTFSAANLISAYVPGGRAVYGGNATVTQGTLTAEPALGGSGAVSWNPGVVAPGAQIILTYEVDVTPNAAGQRVVITGTPAANGTTAAFLDETGNASQAAATYTFGPLREQAATVGGAAIPADTDNDGISDAIENTTCTDPADPDSDNDGLCDGAYDVLPACVTGEDLNMNGTVEAGESDPCLTDSDGDGLDDYEEVITYGTDPLLTDTDGDGMDDLYEITSGCLDPLVNDLAGDQDGDSLTTLIEAVTQSATNDLIATTTFTSGTLDGWSTIAGNGFNPFNCNGVTYGGDTGLAACFNRDAGNEANATIVRHVNTTGYNNLVYTGRWWTFAADNGEGTNIVYDCGTGVQVLGTLNPNGASPYGLGNFSFTLPAICENNADIRVGVIAPLANTEAAEFNLVDNLRLTGDSMIRTNLIATTDFTSGTLDGWSTIAGAGFNPINCNGVTYGGNSGLAVCFNRNGGNEANATIVRHITTTGYFNLVYTGRWWTYAADAGEGTQIIYDCGTGVQVLGTLNPDGSSPYGLGNFSFTLPATCENLADIRVGVRAPVANTENAEFNLVDNLRVTGDSLLPPIGTNPCNADSDGDGMDDGWEDSYACVDPLVPDDTANTDGDGCDNGEEYAQATNPCVNDCTPLCTDADGDGYGVGCALGPDCNDANVNCTTVCTDVDSDGYCITTDCDDAIASCTTDCTDADSDGLALCAGDCNDTNANCDTDCTDVDTDGYCITTDCDDAVATCATDCTDADSDGLALCAGDCNDANANCDTDCTDVDADGYCITTDCDDAIASCATDCTDADSDGLALCAGDCNDANANCDTDCTDVDSDGYCITTDCNDGNANCDSDCTDADSDGYCVTTDCNDANMNCATDCTDADSDGYCVTTDCDDGDNGINPGAGEIICDAIDQDCDGLADDDWDADADLLSYCNEVVAGTQDTDPDSDDDGLTDYVEVVVSTCLNPLDPDTDNDSLADGSTLAVTGEDLDNDGIVDPGETDPCDDDSDDDLLPDGWEHQYMTCGFDPTSAASEILVGGTPQKIGADVRVTIDPSYSMYSALVFTGSEYGMSWEDGRDGNDEIYFARLASNGAKIGGDLRISADASNSWFPTLVSAGSEFGLSWMDNRDGNYEIYFARLAADGTKIGADIRVTTAAGDGSYPSLVFTGSEYGVSWADYRNGNPDIYFVRLAADGTKIGADVQVTNNPAGSVYPSLAFTGSGYGVTWMDMRNGNYDLYFALLDVDGTKLSADLVVTTNANDNQYPAMVFTGSEFGVSWMDGAAGNYDILFTRLDATGTKIGGDLPATDGTPFAEYPSLVFTGSEFGVSWNDWRFTGDGPGIYFAHLAADGTKIGNDFLAAPNFIGVQDPALVFTGSEYGLGWSDARDFDIEMYFARLNSGGPGGYTDKDSDGLKEDEELAALTDPCDPDSDNDTLSDGAEVHTHLTDPTLFDTDGDGMDDGWEVAYDSCVNPLAGDSIVDADSDTMSNLDEYNASTNPCVADCQDNDGDSYGTGCVAGPDCNDANMNCATDCTDVDTDGYCITTDCDDAVASCTTDCTDADSDGLALCAGDCNDANVNCTTDCTDVDTDGYCITTDCDDAVATCATDCTDADSDGLAACAGDCNEANPNCTTDCTDVDADGFCVTTDCNDTNANCDSDCTDADSDGYCVTTDCNDANLNTYPGAPEVCDGLDNQCPGDPGFGTIDEGCCADGDGDGYGVGCVLGPDCNDANFNCSTDCTDVDTDGYCVTTDCDDAVASCTTDCTDADSDGLALCAGDCNDANVNCTTDCTDLDTDGYCITTDCDDAVASCTTDCTDADLDGLAQCAGDCNDANGNCTTDCTDLDTDGYCVTTDCDDAVASCTTDCTDADSDGLALCAGDCNDANVNCTTDCTDVDTDGYCITTDCDDAVASCTTDCTDADSDGLALCAGDCNEANPNCTTDCTDVDTDGYCVTTDCDDASLTVFPGAPELCDLIDNQCPGDPGFGTIDEGCGPLDTDGDGLTDDDETNIYFTNPNDPDTDHDGLDDYLEVITKPCLDALDDDSDADGLTDGAEDVNADGVVDPAESDPCNPDTDGDWLEDGDETGCLDKLDWDTDGDYLPDGFEQVNIANPGGVLNPCLPADGPMDFDGDENTNEHEFWNGTSPWTVDPVPIPGYNPACYYWGKKDNSYFVQPSDIVAAQYTYVGIFVDYSMTIPHSYDTLDLNRDQYIDPPDITFLQYMYAMIDRPSGYPSSPNLLTVLSEPAGPVAVGDTTHVTLSLHAQGPGIELFSPGFAAVFWVESGNAKILGGEGTVASEPAGNRYDITMDPADGAPANLVVVVEGPGPIVINARVPNCGELPTRGRWAPAVPLAAPIVINP